MAEHAQLTLLRQRLKKIRKNKRNTTILALAGSFVIATTLQIYWKEFIFGFVAWLAIGLVSALTIIRYYNSKEAQVLWQIARLTIRRFKEQKSA